MTTLIIALAFLDSISVACGVLALIFLICALIYSAEVASHYGDSRENKLIKNRKLIAGWCILVLIASIPSANDVWKVRLALLKFELASPENIKAGSEHLDKLAKALECKYLDQCANDKAKQ